MKCLIILEKFKKLNLFCPRPTKNPSRKKGINKDGDKIFILVIIFIKNAILIITEKNETEILDPTFSNLWVSGIILVLTDLFYKIQKTLKKSGRFGHVRTNLICLYLRPFWTKKLESLQFLKTNIFDSYPSQTF